MDKSLISLSGDGIMHLMCTYSNILELLLLLISEYKHALLYSNSQAAIF